MSQDLWLSFYELEFRYYRPLYYAKLEVTVYERPVTLLQVVLD